MNDQQRLDFLIAFGQEFSESLCSTVGKDGIVPQDGYEVVVRALGREPSPGVLSMLSESQVEVIRAECERYFECHGITTEQVCIAVARTLARFPNDNESVGTPSISAIKSVKLPKTAVYPARYKDRFGEERTTILNDGETLTMVRYAWPGNVRELQNVIERAVILSKGSTLQVSLAELERAKTHAIAPVIDPEKPRHSQFFQFVCPSCNHADRPVV